MVGVTAAIIGSAVIGAGASMAAGSKAAKAQKSAAAQQVNESRRQYDLTRQDFTPWREAGQGALSKLEMLYGLKPNEGGQTPAQMVAATPGYQFRMDQGMQAIQRSAAARGALKSGGAVKALQRFGDGLASSEYDAFSSRLAQIAGVGQAAAGSTAAAGDAASARIAQAYGNAGDARASAYANTGSAINQGVQNIASAYLWQQGNKAPMPKGGTWI